MKGKTVAPRTMGDFLRDFTEQNILLSDPYLSSMARMIRKFLVAALPEEHRPTRDLIIYMDSTPHEQHGKKMDVAESDS